jgi:hypothetical protein
MPFGKHRGRSLTEVPDGYLAWLLRECKLSSALRAAVADEVRRRGMEPPAPPPPAPPPACWRCGASGEVRYGWQEQRGGRRAIRRSCTRCGGCIGFAPLVPEYTRLADAAASPTACRDVLARAADLDVRLVVCDGAAEIHGEDWHLTDEHFRDRLRECRITLGRMLAKWEEVR